MTGSDAWTDIYEKMCDARASLSKNGRIHEKTGESLLKRNVIRFRDYEPNGPIRRTIWLGEDPEIRQKAQDLLDQWQRRRHPRHSSDPQTRDVWRAVDDATSVLSRHEMHVFREGCKAAADNLLALAQQVFSSTASLTSKLEASRLGDHSMS